MDVTLEGDSLESAQIVIRVSIDEAAELVHALQHSEPFYSGSVGIAALDDKIVAAWSELKAQKYAKGNP